MKREEHEQRTIGIFGCKGTEVHKFLDQFFGPNKFGPYHRFMLHHRAGINLVAREVGGSPTLNKQIAEVHILDDLGYILDDHMAPHFTMDWNLADTWTKGNDYKAEIKRLYPDWRQNVLF